MQVVGRHSTSNTFFFGSYDTLLPLATNKFRFRAPEPARSPFRAFGLVPIGALGLFELSPLENHFFDGHLRPLIPSPVIKGEFFLKGREEFVRAFA